MSPIIVKFIPAMKWWKRPTWELQVSYTSFNKKVTAPTGFVTDGASIPLLLRIIFSPTGKYFGAAIVHDYIIVHEGNYPKAYTEMGDEMDALGIKPWRKFFLLTGIKSWNIFLQLIGKDIFSK